MEGREEEVWRERRGRRNESSRRVDVNKAS